MTAAVAVNVFGGVALGDRVLVGLALAVEVGKGVLEGAVVRVAVAWGVLEGTGVLLGGRDVGEGITDVLVAVLGEALVKMSVAVCVPLDVTDGVRIDSSVGVGVSGRVEVTAPTSLFSLLSFKLIAVGETRGTSTGEEVCIATC